MLLMMQRHQRRRRLNTEKATQLLFNIGTSKRTTLSNPFSTRGLRIFSNRLIHLCWVPLAWSRVVVASLEDRASSGFVNCGGRTNKTRSNIHVLLHIFSPTCLHKSKLRFWNAFSHSIRHSISILIPYLLFSFFSDKCQNNEAHV